MALTNKIITKKLPEYPEVCRLMSTAFPPSEMFPMWQLRFLASRKNIEFRAFYDDDQFCGLMYTAERGNMVYLLYLAVNDKLRSKGYGTQMLNWLKEKTSSAIILCSEAPADNAPNPVQREKRLAFYQRNGITGTGYTTEMSGDKYCLLSSDSAHFDKGELNRLLKWFSFGLYSMKLQKEEKGESK